MASLVLETTDGLTLYLTLEQVGTLQLWNTFTSALEAYNAAHWWNSGSNTYAVAAAKTVQSANISARYAVTIPPLAAGSYIARWYSQQGSNPAVTDGQWVARNDFSWNGTAVVDALALPNALPNAIGGLWTSDNSNGRLVDHCSTVSTVTLVSGSVGSVAGNVNGVVNSVAATIAAGAITSPQNFNNTGQTTSLPITVTPITSTVVNPLPVDVDIVVTQYSAQSFTWTLIDANGNPVDCSGKLMEFKGLNPRTGSVTVSYDTTGTPSNIVIGGTSHNQITVTFATTDTGTIPNTLLYTLWDKTDNLPRAEGKVIFRAAAQP